MVSESFGCEGKLLAGKYLIHRKLAGGGMGDVYLAEHTRLKQPRAIKIIREELLGDEVLRQRFLREIELTHELSRTNDHIVSMYDDYGFEQGLGYYVMEFLEGDTLQERMKKATDTLPASWSLTVAANICLAMEPVHQAQVIHRDLKPSNLFLLDKSYVKDFVKIVDFGIARSVLGTTSLTGSGMWLGTLSYMSPEQLNWSPTQEGGKATLDGRTDIYALGCILFQMLTGQHPFVVENPGSPLGMNRMMMAHLYEPVPSVTALRPELPLAIDPVIARAMAKDKDERYASMAQFRSALLVVLDELHDDTTQVTLSFQKARLEPTASIGSVELLTMPAMSSASAELPAPKKLAPPTPVPEPVPVRPPQVAPLAEEDSASPKGPMRRTPGVAFVAALLLPLVVLVVWLLRGTGSGERRPTTVARDASTLVVGHAPGLRESPTHRRGVDATPPFAMRLRAAPRGRSATAQSRQAKRPRRSATRRRARRRGAWKRKKKPKRLAGPSVVYRRPSPRSVPIRRKPRSATPQPGKGPLHKCQQQSGQVVQVVRSVEQVVINIGEMHGARLGGRVCLYQHTHEQIFVRASACRAYAMISQLGTSRSTLVVARGFARIKPGLRVCLFH